MATRNEALDRAERGKRLLLELQRLLESEGADSFSVFLKDTPAAQMFEMNLQFDYDVDE